MNCIDNIIGVSRNGCECLEVDSSTSLSGLYLDDTTEGRIPLSAAIYDCGDADTVDFLNRIVVDAKNSALEKLSMSLESYFIKKFANASVSIPKKSDYSGPIAEKDYYTFSIRPKVPNLTLYIQSFDILLMTGEFPEDTIIEIWQDGVKIDEGTKTQFIEKRIQIKCDTIFKWTSTAVRDIKHRCCGAGSQWDSLVLFGGSSEDGEDIIYKDSQYSYGVKMKARLHCDYYAFLCDFDFTHGWGMVLAKLVQLIARRNLATWLIDNGKVTTYTTTNEDRLYDLMTMYEKEIDLRLKFLPTEYSYSDCFCNSRHIKGSIIV